jgi:hypothetical protein
MNKKSFFGGMLVKPTSLVLALVFGMAVVGCDNDSTGGGSEFDGSWTKGNYKVVISGAGYTVQTSGTNYQKGIFSYNDTTVSFTGTHAWESILWVAGTYVPSTFGYTLNGNALTLTLISAPNAFDTAFAGIWTR